MMMPRQQETPPDTAPSPRPPRTHGATGRRAPKFHAGSWGLAAANTVVALVVGFLVHQVFWLRLESSSDLALGMGILFGALVAVFGGFFVGRLGRKLAFLEDLLAALLIFAVLLVVVLVGARIEGVRLLIPGLLSKPPGALVGMAAAAVGGAFFFGFVGSSVGFLLGGAGRLDTRFSYEATIARRHLMSKKRTGVSVVTWISIASVATPVWVLVVVLSVMSGFEDDLKSKILGTNAHAVVLKYASAFSEYEEVARDAAEVRGVSGVSPFILGQAMISSAHQNDGVVVKGIAPATVGQVTDLPENVTHGDLMNLTYPERIGEPQTAGGLNPLDAARDPDAARVPTEPTEGAGAGAAGNDAAGNDAAGEGDAGKSAGATGKDAALAEGELTAAYAPPPGTLPGIAIGRELARSMRVFVGDRLTMVSPMAEDMGPTGPVPRSKSFRVAAIFYTGMYEYDSKFAYIHVNEAQRFFDMRGSVTGLELRTTDLDDTRAITRRVLNSIEGYPYYTKDWGEMNRNLFSALKLEKLVMAIILTFVGIIASFVILATLVMMVMERGKDIAILKSMGARDASIMKVFVLEGLTVGVVGTVLGLLLGLGTDAIVASGIIGLDPEVYYISTLPVRIEPLQIVLVSVGAVVLSYLATLYPSWAASRLDPVEGLRDE